jgi:hypothetical protein
VDANVTVLTARSERLTGRVDCNRVERSEVTPDATNLLLEDAVPEPGLELALPLRGRRDGHGVLTSTEDNVWPTGGDGRGVERGVGREGLEDEKVLRSVELWE